MKKTLIALAAVAATGAAFVDAVVSVIDSTGAVVGTSAPRRASQLLNLRPDCKVVTFRGNVATRLKKLADGVAAAPVPTAALFANPPPALRDYLGA